MLHCLGFIENYTRWMSYYSACVSGELSPATPSGAHGPICQVFTSHITSHGITSCYLKQFSNLTVFNTMVNDPNLAEKAKKGWEEGQREFQKVYINLSYLRRNVSRASEKQDTHAGLRLSTAVTVLFQLSQKATIKREQLFPWGCICERLSH